MSGHSKWATIKRKKGATDAARAKLWSKLLRFVEVAARFTDYTGPIMIHCHMLDHEDHGMMARFDVVR